MKKYLINGALALFAGGVFFSCAEKESEYVPLAQQKVKAFEDVFKEVYGDNIDPYQDWGFNGGKTNLDPTDESIFVDVVDADGDLAFTRAAAFGGSNAILAFQNRGTRGESYPNANQWASQGYTVPPELTAGQKLRVQYYFQTVKIINPNRPQYGDLTFFIQQVYDGGDDPMTNYNTGNNPSTGQPYSLEKYLAADNRTYITSGEHMDHLTAGTTPVHIYNFNNGTYGTNGEPNHDVLNSLGVTYHSTGNAEGYHSDQIMLMLNTNTNSFGYANSDASYVRNDRWTLVSWQEIENYCNNSANGYEAWRSAHHSNIPDDSLNDGWGRSFIGFDFDQLPDNDCYTGTTANYGDAGEATNRYVYNLDGTITQYDSSNPKLVIDGKEIPYLDTQTNRYCALGENANIGIGGEDNFNNYDKFGEYSATGSNDNTLYLKNLPGKQSDWAAINMKFIAKLVRAGYLPIKDKGLRRWARIGGCNDGYYSDWIVSFLSSSRSFDQYEESEEEKWNVAEQGRVFCEDLGRATREDLDYNDVVYDVKIWRRDYYYKKEIVKYSDQAKTQEIPGSRKIVEGSVVGPTVNYYAQVTLRAAGGTIPVVIKAGSTDYPVHDQFNDPEPTAIETMVNTRDNNSVAYGSFAARKPVDLAGQNVVKRTFKKTNNVVQEAENKITLNLIPDIERISDIKIWSAFGGEAGTDVQELSSKIGEAPQRFMVPIGTKWTSERKNISLAYPGFNAWVNDRTQEPWGSPNNDYTYDVEKPYAADGQQLPLAMRVKRTYTLEGEHILFEGAETFGFDTNWTLHDFSIGDISAIGSFSAGDRIRFYAKDMPVPANGENYTNDNQKAWITVVIGSIRPYFVDQEFPNYEFENGVKVFKTEGCMEVVLDDYSADLLNAEFAKGQKTMQVQGRNFTLTKICVVAK